LPGGRIPIGIAEEPGSPGFTFGGPTSGTFALVIGPQGSLVDGPGIDDQALAAARAGREVVTLTDFDGTPLRVYSAPLVRGDRTFVVQVAADRTAELNTLQATFRVLVLGSVAVLVVAAAFGWVYAGRALVPIRESLRHQREFAADASHELRTPVTVVRGNVDVLRADPTLGPQARAAIEEIDAEAKRMTSLVDQLLLLARTDSSAVDLEVAPIDAADEATGALEGFTTIAASRNVRLSLEVEPSPMQGDATRLRQLFGILVDNAVRHARTAVNVTVRRRDGHVRATVEDDGNGIRPEDLPRVFDRFWRAADAPEGGSGLGLAIAAWIAERHRGTIRAENRPDGGARFIVELPAS
jgi:signal transduction histidine kinase